MLLAIDIGNSLTKFGVFEGDALVQRLSIPTVRQATADEIYNFDFQSIRRVVISSVVPELKNAYLELCRERFQVEPIFVDASFDFNLKINYQPPENLGVDRLVAAFAATEKYGAPCIVGDFGTATTIDAVNGQREFLGGIIAPGMRLMSEALNAKTAQLPEIKIEKPARVIGDSTVRAIEAGIYFGYIGLVDGIVARMKSELGESSKVVATGGFANLIREGSAQIETVDENLMLEGLRLIYEKSAAR